MTFDPNKAILIIGGDGLIGSHLADVMRSTGKTIWQTTRHPDRITSQKVHLDLSCDISAWTIPDNFQVAIFCAAITSVQKCEEEPGKSRLINVINTVKLAERFTRSGIFVVFLSSTQVFDGNIPFVNADHLVNPQTKYGEQKAEAEKQILQLGGAVIRIGKIITSETPFLSNWISELKNNKKIHPFFDMVMAPVALDKVLETIIRVAEKKQSQIFQLSATQDISYASAAKYIGQKIVIDEKLIEAVSYKAKGIKFSPQFTTLNCISLAEIGLIPPDPNLALDFFLSKIHDGI